MKLKRLLAVVCLLYAMLFTRDSLANVWFKGKAAMRDNLTNVEKHQFLIRWMRKARGAEDAMVVFMGIPPKSPVFQKAHTGMPIELLFDMCNSKGKSIGELKFVVPEGMWEWNSHWVMNYLQRWDRNFHYYDDDWLSTKVVTAYFHAFFTPPKECVTLFLKTVRTCEEDVYYDMKTVAPKIIASGLKASIDKRSIRCRIEMNAFDSQDTDADRTRKDENEVLKKAPIQPAYSKIDNDDRQRDIMLKNTRTLRNQLNELKSMQSELTSEIRMLKEKNNQLMQRCERLQEEKSSLVKDGKADRDALKEKTDLLNKNTLQLHNIEIAHSESIARVKGVEKEIESFKQDNQALKEQVDAFQVSRWKYFALGVILGLLLVVCILKFLN